jgi:hypothetical protein
MSRPAGVSVVDPRPAVLGKLGVPSRRAAADQAARLGLTGDLTIVTS